MIRAIAHSKDRSIKINENGQDVSINFRESYNAIEDFFTAAIFSRLSYLDGFFWEKMFDINFGKLVYREFWPRWKDATGTQYEVEPDVFLRFEKCDLIIEAKRNDNSGQYKDQIIREIEAYKAKFGQDEKMFYLFAVGGNGKNIFQDIGETSSANIKAFDWQDIFNKVKKLNMNVNLKEDLLLAFDLHGIRELVYLKDILSPIVLNGLTINYEHSAKILVNGVKHIQNWDGLSAIVNTSVEYNKNKDILQWK